MRSIATRTNRWTKTERLRRAAPHRVAGARRPPGRRATRRTASAPYWRAACFIAGMAIDPRAARELVDMAQSGNTVLFTGAGFSIGAR